MKQFLRKVFLYFDFLLNDLQVQNEYGWRFHWLLVAVFGQTTKSYFTNVSSFVTQEACDQDRTYYIGNTKKGLLEITA